MGKKLFSLNSFWVTRFSAQSMITFGESLSIDTPMVLSKLSEIWNILSTRCWGKSFSTNHYLFWIHPQEISKITLNLFFFFQTFYVLKRGRQISSLFSTLLSHVRRHLSEVDSGWLSCIFSTYTPNFALVFNSGEDKHSEKVSKLL